MTAALVARPGRGGSGRGSSLKLLFRLLALLGIAAPALLLAGCNEEVGCQIGEVYPLLQINGRSGLTKSQVEKAGVKLCARHTGREETYRGEDACSVPDEVFPDGIIPDIMTGDTQALLLVKCPSNSYPKNRDLQRVICSRDLYFDEPDSEIKQKLAIHFDSSRWAANCQTFASGWESEGTPAQLRGPLLRLPDSKQHQANAIGADAGHPSDTVEAPEHDVHVNSRRKPTAAAHSAASAQVSEDVSTRLGKDYGRGDGSDGAKASEELEDWEASVDDDGATALVRRHSTKASAPTS